MGTIPHDIAERLREKLAEHQEQIYLADDVPMGTRERLMIELSLGCFRLVDELEGIAR
jgi:hypothetical protein